MPTLLEAFDDVSDPRMAWTRKHSLRDILVLSVLAVICGADGFVQIEDFGNAKEGWLKTNLKRPHAIPSHDSIGRVFSMLSPDALAEAFMGWVGTVAERVEGEAVAIDGKTVRRSKDGATNRGPIHLVNAWAMESQLVLGQVRTSEKSNELTAIPELLEVLDLHDGIVTIDAMGCDKAIATDIRKAGADDVLALKDNHPTLHNEVRGFFEDGVQSGFVGIPHDHHEDSTSAHDRDEVRSVWTTSDLEWLPEAEEWDDLKSIVCVEARRTVLGKAPTVHRRYFVSSIADLSAKHAAWGHPRTLGRRERPPLGARHRFPRRRGARAEGARRTEPPNCPYHRPQPAEAGEDLKARHEDQETARRLGSQVPTQGARRLDPTAVPAAGGHDPAGRADGKHHGGAALWVGAHGRTARKRGQTEPTLLPDRQRWCPGLDRRERAGKSGAGCEVALPGCRLCARKRPDQRASVMSSSTQRLWIAPPAAPRT